MPGIIAVLKVFSRVFPAILDLYQTPHSQWKMKCACKSLEDVIKK